MIGNGNCLIIGTDAYKAGEDCLKELFKKGEKERANSSISGSGSRSQSVPAYRGSRR